MAQVTPAGSSLWRREKHTSSFRISITFAPDRYTCRGGGVGGHWTDRTREMAAGTSICKWLWTCEMPTDKGFPAVFMRREYNGKPR